MIVSGRSPGLAPGMERFPGDGAPAAEYRTPAGAPLISIIIPVYNEEGNLKECLGSIFASRFPFCEVIVVDDGSRDRSLETARKYPVRIFRQEKRRGPSLARNLGAERARGRFLVFTDADCLFPRDLLEKTARRLQDENLRVFGGTYQPKSADGTFVSEFHAVRANYYETRKSSADYLASHYLVIERELFREVGGFRCDGRVGRSAACEDLELSRRLIEVGFTLKVFPELAVMHRFGFGVWRSLRNAFRKSRLWVRYLRAENRLAADTGVGSSELKLNVALVLIFLAGMIITIWTPWGLLISASATAAMAAVNRGILLLAVRQRGFCFALGSFFYYCFPFAFFAGLGGAAGLLDAAAGPEEDGIDPVP